MENASRYQHINKRIYNAHLLSADVYIRLDSSDNIIGINIYKSKKSPYSVGGLYLYYTTSEYTLFFHTVYVIIHIHQKYTK